ncbi:MAG: hypothetical protein J6M53_02690 [Bacteroidaceae bacterium]|nr:hypothetical protein [Bacteroidaceae bacterium]
MKMKRLFLSLVLAAVAASVPAQQVYDMVFDSATRTVNDPTSSYTQVKLAQFKKTALTYMRVRAEASDTLVSYRVLDYQAYYLSQFTTAYLREILRYSGDHQKGNRETAIRMFIKASLDCPMWNDPDTATSQAYVSEDEELTPFSLDTDWQKAFEEVQYLLRQIPGHD